MTPSEAHNSAWQRGMDHDEMTIACRDFIETSNPWLHLNAMGKAYQRGAVECEQFFTPDKGPRFFSDITVNYYRRPWAHRDSQAFFLRLFEIKPKIYSAGALMRQVAVQRERAKVFMESDRGDIEGIKVSPIVLEGDPLLPTYRKLSRETVYVWDGTRLKDY
jgi:hypothetical protein